MIRVQASSAPRLTVIHPERDNAVTLLLSRQPFERPSQQMVLAFAFAISVTLHMALLPLNPWRVFRWHAPAAPIEIDLTDPYQIVSPDVAMLSKLVRKGNPEGTGKALTPPLSQSPPRPGEGSSKKTPAVLPLPPQVGEGGGEGIRTGSLTGSENATAEYALVSLTAAPRLKNQAELADILRRYYPESERQAGRQARVVLDLHISISGEVSRAEVVQSAGAAFDAAALQVAHLLQFAPARVGRSPVPVKLRQTIAFRLD